MPPPPPRRRFQIHLSTAIVLMFSAGPLIWANTIFVYANGYRYYGWPLQGFSYTMDPGIDSPLDWSEDGTFRYGLDTSHIFIDFGVAFFILFFVWFLLESLIRRRASKKGP